MATDTVPQSFSSDDKKNDELQVAQQSSGGFLWRMSTGVLSTATGAVTGTVGYGFSGVKWVAGKTVDVGSAVVSKTADAGVAVKNRLPVPGIPSNPFVTKKDKKE